MLDLSICILLMSGRSVLGSRFGPIWRTFEDVQHPDVASGKASRLFEVFVGLICLA